MVSQLIKRQKFKTADDEEKISSKPMKSEILGSSFCSVLAKCFICDFRPYWLIVHEGGICLYDEKPCTTMNLGSNPRKLINACSVHSDTQIFSQYLKSIFNTNFY